MGRQKTSKIEVIVPTDELSAGFIKTKWRSIDG